MSTITMDLIHNVLDTRYQDFSSKNIEDAKNQLIDIIATTVSGVNAPGNSIMLDLIRRWGGSKEATILVHGDKVTLHLAAMMNSMMSRSFDYEAVGPLLEGPVCPVHILERLPYAFRFVLVQLAAESDDRECPPLITLHRFDRSFRLKRKEGDCAPSFHTAV